MFNSLQDRLSDAFKTLRGKKKLDPEDIDAVLKSVRVALLEADVAAVVVRKFISECRTQLVDARLNAALDPEQHVVKVVNDELVKLLGETVTFLKLADKPAVIMLVGLQGVGKTTFAGKLALRLQKLGHFPLLVAADLQRPNAVNQLQIVGEKAGVPVYAPFVGGGAGDPIEVAKSSLTVAKEGRHDVIIVDTAGRLSVDEKLMTELSRMKEVLVPEEIFYVLDAMAGQDAVNVAAKFREGTDFTGVVLTKLDGDSRGGAALSVASVAQRPIFFASTGEKLEDLDVFHPDRIASRILGMGDVLTLIEQAEEAFDAQQVEKMTKTLETGQDFTLEDFLSQMRTIRQMGSMSKLLGMLPGMGEIREQIESFDEKELDKVEAIISSMTDKERKDPSILNRSRRERVAKGTGVAVKEVDELLEKFRDAQKMMREMLKSPGSFNGLLGGMPTLPASKPIPPKPQRKPAPKRTKKPKKHHRKKR